MSDDFDPYTYVSKNVYDGIRIETNPAKIAWRRRMALEAVEKAKNK